MIRFEIILLQFLMGDFLRLSIKTVVLEIRILCCFLENKNCTAVFCIFSLRIVKSLQLRGRRQIVELRKYCLCVIIFLWCIFFSIFCILQILEFRVYSHQLILEPRVRFEWEQW